MYNRSSSIITFYSYKGGVGRSMTLANVAWLLANKYGKKVLIVDWDLEAPGLHRFFNISDMDIKRGLIELLNEYKTLLKEETDPLPKKLVDIDKYIISIPTPNTTNDGSLSMLAAGQQGHAYARQVNDFDWDEFYEKWHGFGFIEYLKEALKEKADFVLLDSRTGVTDIGGICTLQLPDVVVLLFSLNEQNITGAELIAENILNKAPEVEKRERPPILILRPARVEKYLELDRKNEWEVVASRRLEQYLLPREREDSLRFMKENAIPYIGAYSFGETPLAVEKDPYEELAKSFDALAQAILKAVSSVKDTESMKTLYFKDRLFLLGRRITYFMSVTFSKNKWLLVTFIVALLSSLLLNLYSYNQLRQTSVDRDNLQKEQIILQQRLDTTINQLEKQNSSLDSQIQRLNDRIDSLYQLLSKQTPNNSRSGI